MLDIATVVRLIRETTKAVSGCTEQEDLWLQWEKSGADPGSSPGHIFVPGCPFEACSISLEPERAQLQATAGPGEGFQHVEGFMGNGRPGPRICTNHLEDQDEGPEPGSVKTRNKIRCELAG